LLNHIELSVTHRPLRHRNQERLSPTAPRSSLRGFPTDIALANC